MSNCSSFIRHNIDFFFIFYSAGVGRSGCFILLDAMLERLDQEGTVDVFKYLRYMRTRRINMVQTFVSYIFFVFFFVFDSFVAGSILAPVY